MGADQPSLDVTADGMDDGKEFGGVGPGILDDRGVLEVTGKAGIIPLIAFETIGQQM